MINKLLWAASKMLTRINGGRTIKVNGDPYLTRAFVLPQGLPFGLFLHYFHRGDSDRDLHNHPWRWAYSLILTGGYLEERAYDAFGEIIRSIVTPGSINKITDRDFHRVDLLEPEKGCWTLFLRGPRTQGWGFWNRETNEFRDWSSDESTED